MKALIVGMVSIVAGSAIGFGMTVLEFSGVRESLDVNRASGLATDAEDGIPRVRVVNGEVYNFGTMELHTEKSHEFIFENVGDAPLSLEVASASCQCTVGDLENGMLYPGETTPITLGWKGTSTREFGESADIRTNDPERPLVQLRIEGYVNATVMADPQELSLGNVSANQTVERRFRVLGFRDETLEIFSAEAVQSDTRDYFDVRIERDTLTDADREKYRDVQAAYTVHVGLKPGLPLGPFNQTIRLSTNISEIEAVEVPVRGTLVSDISVMGSGFRTEANTLLMGTVRRDEGASRTLHVVVKGAHRDDVDMTVAEVDPDVLNVQLGETRESGNLRIWPLTIEVPAGSRQVNRLATDLAKAGRITLETTHPDAKELRIYVRFAVE